uniref:C2H2-type domain-containing protein n=1 Tax=Ascaris lumbricoides TaxID=6252 RepID=A0A0M3IPH8_ASCLU
MKTEPSRGSLLMSHAELIAPLTNNPKRRILRGRKIISLEQVIEEMKADICISAESSNNSESLKNANEINGWKIERQELIRRRAAIREQQRLIHSQVRQSFDPQQYIGGKEVETQLISGGHKNSAMIGRELTKAHALQEVGCNSAAMNLEAARRGFGNKEARRRSKVDAGTKGVTGELYTIATNNKVVQETTSEAPAMLEDEEEPMEIDSTLIEAERSRRKSAMPIELLRRKDGSTRSGSDHFMHRQHPTAAGRYSTGPFKLAGSDVKDLPKEVVKAIEETELENMHNTGDHNATFTVTDPKARNIAQQMMSEEEIAARALIGLSEAANKEAYLASMPAGDASSTLGKRYLMEFFCYLQEVTIISRAMELDESSALKQAPKSRWDDTTIIENQGKARMISDHSSLSAMNATRSMRDELLNILDVTYGGHPIVPKTNRTLLSFKTPKKTAAIPSMKTRTQNVTSCKSASKQTRSAKQGRFSGRVTSTPNEVEAHVCPRFAAHQAASATPNRFYLFVISCSLLFQFSITSINYFDESCLLINFIVLLITYFVYF